MKRKKALALASLSMILLASFALFPIPPAYAIETHSYTVMQGWLNSAGRLGANPPWNTSGYLYKDGVPFATRPPYVMPLLDGMDITFSDKDDTTGIVTFTVPSGSYTGLDHMWWSYDVGTWFRAIITMDDDGCGWIFTGEGTSPVFGSVDLLTYGNLSGVYTYGPDGQPYTADDELMAGEVAGAGPGGGDGSAGAGPPIGPCLQNLRGTDNIPGTNDDPIGRGDPDGPDEAGHSIMYLPGIMNVTYWIDWPTYEWAVLFVSPWPQLLTTGTTRCTIIDYTEVGTCPINGSTATQTGQPWEFLAGKDGHGSVNYGDSKWNAYVTYVACWSVINTASDLGVNDTLMEVKETSVRDDLLIADINGDEVCNIVDIVICALAFDCRDEWIGADGIPMTGDDMKDADADYDARGDLRPDRGKVNIVDIVRIALDFDEKIEP